MRIKPNAAFFMMVCACSERLLSSAVIHKIPPHTNQNMASAPRIPMKARTTRPNSCGMLVTPRPSGFNSSTVPCEPLPPPGDAVPVPLAVVVACPCGCAPPAGARVSTQRGRVLAVGEFGMWQRNRPDVNGSPFVGLPCASGSVVPLFAHRSRHAASHSEFVSH